MSLIRTTSALPTANMRADRALVPIIATICALCLLLLTGCSSSEDDTESLTPDPLLYEIANADGEVEGWMLGTIHALPDGVSWRTDRIESVVSEADVLLVEVANLEDRGAIAAIFARLATTPGLGPLRDRVAPDLRDDVGRIIERSGTSPDNFYDTESWAAAIMLTQVDASGEPSNGVDRALIRDFARRDVRGFETAEEQLGIFDKLAEEDQRELLEGTVREWVQARETPGRLMRAWLTGDLETIEEATSSGIMADPELREALLVGRNRDWMAPLIATLETEDRPLVAVGTAHLVGPDGLGAMLEAQGYSVKRLR